MEPFAAQLTRHRQTRRLSMEGLAERADIDLSLVSRLTTGKRTPTPTSIAKLCTGLGLAGYERNAFYLAAGFVPPGSDLEALARLLTQAEAA